MLLAMVMVLGMSVTAFAANDNPQKTLTAAAGTAADKGTITINGLGNDKAKDDANLTIAAYQIITANYGGNNDVFSGYTEVYKDKLTLPEGTSYLNLESIEAGGTLTISDEKYLNAVKKYIDENNVTTAYTAEISEKTNTYSFKEMPVGAYLILITGAESNIYSPVVASIYYSAVKDSEGLTTGNQYTSGVALDLSGANLWVKKTENPTLDKNIVDNQENDSNSANIGDNIPYEISVKPIPYYGGDHPVFNIVDTLDKGLTYNNDIKIVLRDESGNKITDEEFSNKVGDDYSSVLTVTPGEKTTISIDFAKNKNYLLNKWQGKELYITYSATLNDNATMNQIANVNDVVLTYTHDSKVNNDGVKGKEEDKTFTYTFDIDAAVEGSITERILTKVGDAEKVNEIYGKALTGAVFGIYKAEACNEADLYTNGTNTNKNNVVTGQVTSDKNGQLKIKGLKAEATTEGTSYYLKEIKAPAGYSLNTNVYKINIKPVYNSDSEEMITSWTVTISTGDTTLGTNVFGVAYTKDMNGNVTNTEVTLNKKDGEENVVFNNGTIVTDKQQTAVDGADINNTKLTSLPSTGGIGTTIFTIGGCAIMVIAASLFFATRRKAEK